ncbi:MAG: hypothetical protein IT459_08465 [Planctomycetes bacterium]|nr:hypothetical protein [Planctomycetota bacterium]
MSRTRLAPFAVALAALVPFAASAPAQTQIVFTEYAFNNPKIKAMDLNGQNVFEPFTIPTSFWVPLDLTFDVASGQFLWADYAGTNRILRAQSNGAGLTTVVTTSGGARGPRVDAQGRLYYVDGNTLRRVNANGSGMQILFTAQQSFPLGCPLVDATNGHVYVGADGTIRRFDLDGSHPKTVVTGISIARTLQLDVANGFIYWIDTDTITDHIARARLDGTQPSVVIDNTPAFVQSPGMNGFVIDPASDSIVYSDDLFSDHIVRTKLDGSNPVVLYQSTGGLSPSGLTLDSGPMVQPMADCNGNGIADATDLVSGFSQDCNGNGFPDECEENPCPTPTYFLDHGSNPVPPSRTLGCSSTAQNTCFDVFQPFDVPAPGVSLGSLELDGWTANYGFGSGFTATLFPDDGSGQFPNESAPIVAAAMQFRFNPNTINWVTADFSAALLPGRYWVRLTANEPAYHAGVNIGTSGLLQSKQRSGLGTWFTGSPIAMRLATTPLAASPPQLSLAAGGIQDFVLDAGLQHANKAYWLLGCVTGSSPGLPLNSQLTLPLNYDAYLLLLLQNPNAPPLLNAFATLDGSGKSTAQFTLPSNSPPILVGLTFHHAYVVLSPTNAPEFVSNAVVLELAP